jgi:hypothetical protein
MLPYLVITDCTGTKIYAEIVYARPLSQRKSWLHIVTAGAIDFARYTATYTTNKGAVVGIYSVFAAEVTNDTQVFKGLFEPT